MSEAHRDVPNPAGTVTAMKTCAGCIACEQIGSRNECHLNPPQVTPGGSSFPTVKANDWCMQYRPTVAR